MTSVEKDLVLRMINHAQDKSIEELTTHITEVKQGLDSLRNSDVRSLIKYTFSLDMNERGYFDHMDHEFHKRNHGTYAQHMAAMNAIEARIKRDAPDISDEASMDIRIIKSMIEQIYKFIGSTQNLQMKIDNPKSYLFAVIGAEYILNLLPKGTHDYEKFIKPSELAGWIRNSGLTTKETIGLSYNPITDNYWLGKDIQVNYMVHAKKEEG